MQLNKAKFLIFKGYKSILKNQTNMSIIVKNDVTLYQCSVTYNLKISILR